jgi:hypothetical protein
VPDMPAMPGRPQLPAPSPQSFSYPAEVPTPWLPRKASFDVVPETTGSANEIRRLLESLPPEDTTAPLVRGPVAITNMPRGAYP